jgi:hypothetical protein
MIAVQEKIKGQNFTSRLLAFCFVHHKHFENQLLAGDRRGCRARRAA